ncbi:CsgG/HfaB family protein [Limimaricola cinnabarinus]|uniref:Curli production assembly protein CsgG n=1 Tax=Limimaricola cinnabarinus TaxID=1125964 RepID=A0A2G1MBX7_9RHOB|nr:CsgG/HfaB family protein [Limimaricola cinnabarinus]PHP26233.1 curli production assembly protein CsgG [Limimaricola cinnabarinus]
MNAAVSRLRGVLFTAALTALSGCAELTNYADDLSEPPELTPITGVGLQLAALPPPAQPVDIAVYDYEDKTGQQEPNDAFSTFSKAVSQGNEAILIDVLTKVGGSHWFNVIERASVQNLLAERNLIDQTTQSYGLATQSTLPPLRFAGIILAGGVTNYESNIMTSGAGARLLGVGASTEYRRDDVTVALRAVSVANGEVLVSTTAEKTIYSTLVRGGVFKFIATDEILESETGFSRNEPTGLAVRQAIELAVLNLIVDGARKGIWRFQDHAAGQRVLAKYDREFAARRNVANVRPAVDPS